MGHARAPTADQDLAAQLDQLNAPGCGHILQKHASGALRERPKLDKCLDCLRKGDTLVVAMLDRLSRSLDHLLEVVTGLDERGIRLRSLAEAIDTSTMVSWLLLHVVGAVVAQFELDLIIERTHAGLAAARTAARTGGRSPKVTHEKLAHRPGAAGGRADRPPGRRPLEVGKSTLHEHLGTTEAVSR